jgi:hypothetical protein
VVKWQEDRQFTYKCKIKALSRKNVCRGKAMIITNSVCVFVDFVIQHAKRMRPIWCTVICGLSGSSTLSHKRNDFRENVIEHKNVCFGFLYNFV